MDRRAWWATVLRISQSDRTEATQHSTQHETNSKTYLNNTALIVGFSGSARGKEPACQCWRCKRRGFALWVRKIPWKRKWQATPIFFHGERSLVGYSHGVAKSQTQLKQLSMQALEKRSPKSRCWQGHALPRILRGLHPCLFLLFGGTLAIVGFPWLAAAQLQSLPPSLCGSGSDHCWNVIPV